MQDCRAEAKTLPPFIFLKDWKALRLPVYFRKSGSVFCEFI